MKFTHLIEINDPLNPLIDTLTREQLWRGLVLRAETPKAFIPWLDRCTIVEKSETHLARISHYGQLAVHDSVQLIAQQKIIYTIPPQKDIPASSLTMTIEEPEPGILFVRFEYEDSTGEAADSEQAMYNDFRKSAYQEADIDTIRIIRQMVESGELG
jgi:hypothetical protein